MARMFEKSVMVVKEMSRTEKAIRAATAGLSQSCVLPVELLMAEDEDGMAARFYKQTALTARVNGFDLDKQGVSHYTKGAQKALDACINPGLYKRSAKGALLQKSEKELQKEKESKTEKKEEAPKPRTKADYQAIIDRLLKEQAEAPEA